MQSVPGQVGTQMDRLRRSEGSRVNDSSDHGDPQIYRAMNDVKESINLHGTLQWMECPRMSICHVPSNRKICAGHVLPSV